MDWKLVKVDLESYWLAQTDEGKRAIDLARETFADAQPGPYERTVREMGPWSMLCSTDEIEIAAQGLVLTWRVVEQ
jgi:hypothetical protein